MRIQSSHHHADRGLDAYFSPPEATASLLGIEAGHQPQHIWEPAAGDGAIVRPLQMAGFNVIASDIVDYGLVGCRVGIDYLKARPIGDVQAIVTNPPFKLAQRFAEKALTEVPYLALLLRTNFVESMSRLKLFRKQPLARIWISSRRLPMMHRPRLARSSRTQQHLPRLVRVGSADRAKVGDALVRLERLPVPDMMATRPRHPTRAPGRNRDGDGDLVSQPSLF